MFGKFSCSEKGIISRSDINVKIRPNSGLGIRFILPSTKIIPVNTKSIFSSQRNTVLGDSDESLCLVEHFLAACSLLDINNIDVEVDNFELPFADGSAMFWIEELRKSQLVSENSLEKRITVSEEFIIFDENDISRFIKVRPSDTFSVNYVLDMPQSFIARREAKWTLGEEPIEVIARARTFSNEEENKLLGLSGWVLGYTETDFTMPLYSYNEPAMHKALDLIGDLRLIGFNPLSLNADIISSKGGHALNTKLACYLAKNFSPELEKLCIASV